MEETFEVYVTKNALTSGIEKKIVSADCDIDPHMVTTVKEDNLLQKSYFKNQWWDTKEEAIIKAEEMKLKKIESLKKQIIKLENKKFD